MCEGEEMSDPLAYDSSSETDMDDRQPNNSPKILGPTPQKRPRSLSSATRRLDFGADFFDYGNRTLTSTPRIGSERNAAPRTVARLNKPPQGHRTSNIPPRNDGLLSLPDVGSNPERPTTRFAANAPATIMTLAFHQTYQVR